MLRFRPILMTTVAALFGALPLAFGTGIGSELRRPLGITIVGGLIMSQLLTLYTTPVVYLFLDRLRLRFGGAERNPASSSRTEAVPAAAVHGSDWHRVRVWTESLPSRCADSESLATRPSLRLLAGCTVGPKVSSASNRPGSPPAYKELNPPPNPAGASDRTRAGSHARRTGRLESRQIPRTLCRAANGGRSTMIRN